MEHLLNKVISGIIIVLIVILLGLNQWVTIIDRFTYVNYGVHENKEVNLDYTIDSRLKWFEVCRETKMDDENLFKDEQKKFCFPIDNFKNSDRKSYQWITVIFIVFICLVILNSISIKITNPKYLFTINILTIILLLAIIFISYYAFYKPYQNKHFKIPNDDTLRQVTTVKYSNSFWICCSIYLLVLFQIGYNGYIYLKSDK